MTSRPEKIDPNQRYSVNEAVGALGLGRNSLYKLIREKKISVIKTGRRTHVPGSEIIRLSTLPGTAA